MVNRGKALQVNKPILAYGTPHSSVQSLQEVFEVVTLIAHVNKAW
jgi:hypothetical protein